MSKFNTKTTNKVENLAGGKAFRMGDDVELIHAVLTTFLEDKFYEDGDTRALRIKHLVAVNDPEFVAKLAYITRTEFNLRSVSTLLLGELAKNHKGDDLVMRAVKNTVTRVDDITELVSYLDAKLPKQVKRGIRRALLKFKGYQLAKYRGEGKKVKLVDVFNLTHPNPKFATEAQKEAWAALMKGELKTTGQTWESVISASKDKKQDWEALVKEHKLGYMALIRNLNNFIKNGVSEKVVDMVVEQLTDVEAVLKSKQLPFRFLTAYENVSGNRKLKNAISEAMDIAVSNTPEFKGNTLIGIDSSGSMQGETFDKATIFGATLYKANEDADMTLYDTSIRIVDTSSRKPVIDIVQDLKDISMGGGTETGLVFDYATEVFKRNGKIYDRIIILSDNESWSEGMYGSSVQARYMNYKKLTGADPFVYAIDIAGYGTKDVTGNKVFHLTGWSDRLLDFVGAIEKGETLVDYIKSIELI